MRDVFTNINMVIILQYVYQIMPFKLTQCLCQLYLYKAARENKALNCFKWDNRSSSGFAKMVVLVDSDKNSF